ncbi:glucosidase, partial [Plakobranchus ocellatus]
GNHGEDVKELYYYLDNTPKHTYMKALYKYPQQAFPYEALVNHNRTVYDPELEILDTGVFDKDYWDVQVEYAKPIPHTIMCKITVINQSENEASLDIIPQFYFRNTWSKPGPDAPTTVPLFQGVAKDGIDAIYELGIYRINFSHGKDVTLNSLLFTNNNSVAEPFPELALPEETNSLRPSVMSGVHSTLQSWSRTTSEQTAGSSIASDLYKKDAFHRYIIDNNKAVVKKDNAGTKCCAWMSVRLQGKGKTSVYWQMFPADSVGESSIRKLDQVVERQRQKADAFYHELIPSKASPEEVVLCRQAIAGILWSKQLYLYNMEQKNKELKQMHGKEYFKTKFGQKRLGWNHLNCHDILLMPDKWEFPWFAAWDLAFHCVSVARVDMPLAKEQLMLLLSDRYMHQNGQVPGCEFDLGDTNPPIIVWAVWKIFSMEKNKDVPFLKTCFHRLIFCLQWWNKMDPTSMYLYGNGFMGLDNISIFDRSELPNEILSLKQADCTGWMGLFTLTMLKIAVELCNNDISYTDMAIKFLRHFLFIARAINCTCSEGGLWDEEDKFFYDVAYYQEPHSTPVRIRSWSGIIPLLACCSINLHNCQMVKTFLLKCDRHFSPFVCKLGENEFFLTLVSYTKLKLMLKTIFSEDEFLSPYGIRSMSKIYETNPYTYEVNGTPISMTYLPGESDTNLFGGNSNWRGPIWLCMNYLFVECLEKYSDLDRVFTLPLSVHYPTKSPTKMTFVSIAQDLCRRIISIFLPGKNGIRPIHGTQEKYAEPDWQKLLLFYEYIHAETGRGCGASHQTGWTALVVEFILKLRKT